MARSFAEILERQSRYGAPDPILERKVLGKLRGTAEDFKELSISVRSILVSSKNQFTVNDICREYKTLFGKRFPVQELGYSSAVDVLKKLSDACVVDDDGDYNSTVRAVISEKSAHISDLVKRSKAPIKRSNTEKRPKEIFVPFYVQDSMRYLLYRNRKGITRDAFCAALEEMYDLEFLNIDVPLDTMARSLPHLLIHDGRFVRSPYIIDRSEVEVPHELHFDGEHIIPSYRLSKAECAIAEKIQILLEKHMVLYLEELPLYYSNTFGKELKCDLFGFRDLWRFVALLPGDFKMYRVEERYVLALQEFKETSELPDIRERRAQHFCGPTVFKTVQEDIKRIVEMMNKGLNSKHLEPLYEEFYHRKLVLRTDIYDFLRELRDNYMVKLKNEGGKLMIYPNTAEDLQAVNIMSAGAAMEVVDSWRSLKPPTIEKGNFLESGSQAGMHPSTKVEIPKTPCRVREYPENVLGPEDCIAHLQFPEEINLHHQAFCAAFVHAAVNPSNFHIKIIGFGESHKNELDKQFRQMQTKMRIFYSEHYNEMNIYLAHLRMDMICAGCICGTWRRVEIIDIMDDQTLMVKTLDFGTVHAVGPRSLCYLQKMFAVLPVLAYQASLFNIRPVTPLWSTEALRDFRQLFTIEKNRKPLSVLILYKNRKGVLQVSLSDIHGKEEVHFCDRLIKLGHALYKCQSTYHSGMYY